MSKQWSLLAGLFPVVLAGAGVACWGGSQASEAADPGDLQVVRGEFDDRILLTGELVAQQAVHLTAPNVNIWPMTIRYLADDGVTITAGEVVAELDNSQLVSRLDDLEAQVIEQTNQLASLEARLASEMSTSAMELVRSQAEVERTALKAALPKEILSEKTYNDHQLAHRTALLELDKARQQLEAKDEANRAEIELQRLRLNDARQELRRSEAQIEALKLTAPKGGILLISQDRRSGRQYQEGDSVFPGVDIAQLPDLQTLRVEARLFDVDDGRIAPGMGVHATLDAFPERRFKGRVRDIDTIAQELDSRSLRRSFRVQIELDDLDPERMRPGMSVKVVVDTEPLHDVLLIPRQSLTWLEDTPPIRRSRALLADGSWRDVELGACNPMVCVLNSGLDEGARLAPVLGHG